MSRKRWLAALVVVLACLAVTPAVPAVRDLFAPGPGTPHGLRMLVPNVPGGGFDVTARSAAKTLSDTGLTGPVEVFNLPGAGGVAGLGRLVNETGNDRLLLSMGLGVVGAVASQDSRVTLANTTPVARLIEESEIVVVAAGSPLRDVHDLIDTWRADPVALPVGGGSTGGGPDHLATMLLAEGAGIPPEQVDYVNHDGGGALLAAVLAGEVAFGVSGLGEFADQLGTGSLRALAVTADERVPGLAVPTLRESGVDVEFSNWRGVVAPPGLDPDARAALVDLFARLRETPEWQEVLRANGWRDVWLPGEQFGAFLHAEDERVAGMLGRMGLDWP